MAAAPTSTANTTFIGGAVPAIQYMLLSIANYVIENITTTSIDSQQSVISAIQQTLINAIDIINAYQIQTLMAQEYSNIQGAGGLNLSASDLILINNRLQSFNALVQTVYPLPFLITFNINNLTNGQPALQPYDLTSYFVQFNYETPPTGLAFYNIHNISSNGSQITLRTTSTPSALSSGQSITITGTMNYNGIYTIATVNQGTSTITITSLLMAPTEVTGSINNFDASAQNMATAWNDALNLLASAASTPNASVYNPADRMASCCQDIVTNYLDPVALYDDLTSTQLTQVWNSLVALPALLRVFDLLNNDPSSQVSQSINSIKFSIYNLIFQTNAVLASFNAPNNVAQPITSVLRTGESLLDFAARTTGNYANWESVAAANDLQPPYVAATPAPNVAVPGQKLFLPPFTINSALSSYTDAYLGTDINLGLPYTTLTQWTGDFATISGIDNYSGALARRVLTTVGNLIYHTEYGSLLPQQVGSVQTSNEAMLLASYLKAALLADPRTQAVNKITAYPLNFGQIVMTALVSPFGNAQSATPFNLVIIPQSGGSLSKS